MKLLSAVLLMTLSFTAVAEKHSALCLLSTDSGKIQKDRFVEVDDFDTKQQCVDEMQPLTKDKDYVGQGGTNNHMLRVDWNLDCYCIKKRSD